MKHLPKIAMAALVGVLATPGFAATLDPGTVVFPTGTTFADPVHGGVQAIQNDNLIPFTFDPTPAVPFNNVGGNVQNRVTLNQAGTLNFAPRIRDTYNIDGGRLAILSFSLDGFAGYDIDADYRTDGLGDKGFSSISRSVTGDLLTFRFDDPLYVDSINPPGLQDESLFPSLVTDAKNFTNTGTMRVLGAIIPLGSTTSLTANDLNTFSFTIDGIAAPAPIPLPAAAWLLIGGLATLGGVSRRKRRAA